MKEVNNVITVCNNCHYPVTIERPRFIKRAKETVVAGYCPHCGKYLEK